MLATAELSTDMTLESKAPDTTDRPTTPAATWAIPDNAGLKSSHSRSLRTSFSNPTALLFNQSPEHFAFAIRKLLLWSLIPKHCGHHRCTCQSPTRSLHPGIHTFKLGEQLTRQ